MAYNNSYEASDTASVVIDIIVGVGATMFSFASLIGLVLLFNFARARL